MQVVVTGAAGFIGSNLCKKLLSDNISVIGIDSINSYYDPRVKHKRIETIKSKYNDGQFKFYHIDINERETVESIFKKEKPSVIIHLAAQAGVRYCQQNPEEAKRNNIDTTTFLTGLLGHEDFKFIKQFIFASSSSVYGCNERPFKETMKTDAIGFYAESKVFGEKLCREAFERANKTIAVAAVRFFTVYGPSGRPDMAPAKFLNIVHRNKQVSVYGDGSAIRDFTFIDDIVQGITLIMQKPSHEEFKIYNLGKGTKTPNSVLDLIEAIEVNLRKKANVLFTDCQEGDVPATQADITKAETELGYNPQYTLEEGIQVAVASYLQDVEKYFVLALFVSDSLPLKQQLDSIFDQSHAPQLIIVVDDSSTVEDNKQLVASAQDLHKSTEFYILAGAQPHNQPYNLSLVVNYLQNRLNEKKTAVWEEPSNIFVNFIDFPLGHWPKDHLAVYFNKISERGYEFVSNAREISDFLVRFDSLANLFSEEDLSQADIQTVKKSLCTQTNLRILSQ